MDTGGRDTWGTERQRQRGDRPRGWGDRDPERGGDRDPERGRQTDRLGSSKDLERKRDRHLEAPKNRVGQPGDTLSHCPSPTLLVAQTCRPHVAGPPAGIHEVQVAVGICGLLGSMLITVPLRNHGCPEGILHGHGWVDVPRPPTLAQGPSGGMRVERESWVSPLTPSCTNVHILSTWTLHPRRQRPQQTQYWL